MIASRHVAASIAARFGCWGLMLCSMLLGNQNVRNWFPNDERLLVYLCSLEVLGIIVLLRFAPGKVVRDVIDISLYTLGAKLLLLYAYFFHEDLYQSMRAFYYRPIMAALFLLAFIRIFWLRKTEQGLLLADWPPIGPYGWTAPPMLSAQAHTSLDDKIYTVVAVIVASLLGMISLIAPDGWEYVLTGGSGLIILLAYQGKFDHAFCSTVTTAAEREAKIEFYQSILRDTTAALKELGELGPNHATLRTKLHLVKSDLEQHNPNSKADTSEPPTNSGDVAE